MNNPDKNNVDLGKAFRTSGYQFPIDESEVESFEQNLKPDDECEPVDWDNPLKILERGKIAKVNISFPKVDTEATNNLSMAARDGKDISDLVRKKMDEDRKNSKKQ